jgi:hypothetical protein
MHDSRAAVTARAGLPLDKSFDGVLLCGSRPVAEQQAQREAFSLRNRVGVPIILSGVRVGCVDGGEPWVLANRERQRF